MTGTPPPPPRAGTAAERQALASCFARASFDMTTVLGRLSLRSLDELEAGRQTMLADCSTEDALGALIRLLVLGGLVDVEIATAALGREVVEALARTGVVALATDPSTGRDALWSTVQLVPIEDRASSLFIACDRRHDHEGSPGQLFADMVYSGHNLGTLQFIRMMPRSPVDRALDMCSGTGVIGLAAAGHSGRVVAVDITDRSTAFALFNRWLNGRENLDVRQGDLFEAVRGERFTRVHCHPPYVPSRVEIAVYRDGGKTGDLLLQRIVAGLPDHLEIGGTFFILTLGMDTTAGPFEARVREWLGEQQHEFDVIFAMTAQMTPRDFAKRLSKRVAVPDAGTLDEWVAIFEQAGVHEVVYGALVGRRLDPAAGQAETRRVIVEPTVGPDGFEWLLRWLDWIRQPGRDARLLSAHPALAPGANLEVHHVVRDGHFAPERHRLKNGGHPFSVEVETDGWIVGVANSLDGTLATADAYTRLRAAGALPEAMTQGEFLELVCFLCERGLLSVAEL